MFPDVLDQYMAYVDQQEDMYWKGETDRMIDEWLEQSLNIVTYPERSNIMRGMNQFFGTGRLGQTPDLKTIPKSNTQVCNVSMAITDVWGKGDERKEKTEWVNLVFWNGQADVICKYASKGSRIGIVGRLQTRDWTDDSGTKHYRTEVFVEKLDLIETKNEEANRKTSAPADLGPMSNTSADQDDLPF